MIWRTICDEGLPPAAATPLSDHDCHGPAGIAERGHADEPRGVDRLLRLENLRAEVLVTLALCLAEDEVIRVLVELGDVRRVRGLHLLDDFRRAGLPPEALEGGALDVALLAP